MVIFIYYLGFEYFFNTTLGKYQTQATLVNIQGLRPTLIQITLRNISRFISILPGLKDDERAIHDQVF